jgi:hypothetical protein
MSIPLSSALVSAVKRASQMGLCTEDEVFDDESRVHVVEWTERPYFQYIEYFQYDKSLREGWLCPMWYVCRPDPLRILCYYLSFEGKSERLLAGENFNTKIPEELPSGMQPLL